MRNYLYDLYTFLTKRKFLSAVIVIAVALFLGFFASKITFEENINQMIPSNDKSGVEVKE